MKTRRLLALVLSALMVLTSIPFAVSAAEPADTQAAEAHSHVEPQLTSDAVVFVSDYGDDSNDGSSMDVSVLTIAHAYELLGTAGGTIVICGMVDISNEPLDTYQYTANGETKTVTDGRFQAPAHTGLVKITSVYDGYDYASEGASLNFGTWDDNGSSKSHHYIIGGPTTFENITINASTNPVFYGRGQFITMGEGILNTVSMLVVGYEQNTGLTSYKNESVDVDTHIIIKSGLYHTVAGMTRNTFNGTYTGTAYITVEGDAEINSLAGLTHTANGGYYGDAVIEINGGTFTYLAGASISATNGAYGNVTLTINDYTAKSNGGRAAGVSYNSTNGTYGDVKTEINGGTFNTFDGYTYGGKTSHFGNSDLTVTDGTFNYLNGVCMDTTNVVVGKANTVVDYATIKQYVYGGSFRGAFTANEVSLTFNGGNYSKGTGTLNNQGTAVVNDKISLNVNAGTFAGTIMATSYKGTVSGGADVYVNVTGGTSTPATSMALCGALTSAPQVGRVYYNFSGGSYKKIYVGSQASSAMVSGGGMYFTYSGGSIDTISTAWLTGYQKYYFVGSKTFETTNFGFDDSVDATTGELANPTGRNGWPSLGHNAFNYVNLAQYPTEVYYKTNANGGDYVNDGLTPETAIESIYDAAVTLGPDGGTVYMLSNIPGTEFPYSEGTITYSTVLPGTDGPNGYKINFGSSNLYLQSDTVFDGVVLDSSARENLIAAQGNDLQINDNVTTALGTDGALGIIAGYSVADTLFNAGGKSASELSVTGDQTITVNGGTYNYFYGGNRRWGQSAAVGTYNGNLTVNVGANATFTADSRANDNNPARAFYLTGMNIVKGTVTANLNGTFDLPVFAFGKMGVYFNGLRDHWTGTDGVYIWQDTKNEADLTVNAGGSFTMAGGYIKGVAIAGDTPVHGTFTLDTTGASFADDFTIDAKGYLEATAYTGTETVAVKNFDTVNGKTDLSGEPVRVIALGDSITWGTGAKNEMINGYEYNHYNYNYPMQLQKLLGEGAVIGNYGYPGAHAYYTLGNDYYGSSSYGMSLQFGEADAVIIALGTNDSANVAVEGVINQAGADSYLDSMRRLIETYHAVYPTATIYITTALPRWTSVASTANTENVVIPLQKQLAGEYSYAKTMDLFTAMKPYADSDKANANGNYYYGSDNLHPANPGYAVMAEAVADEIKSDFHYYAHTHVDVECEADGCDSFVCTFCGDSYTENVVKAPGHDLYETDRLDATTEAEGYVDWACRSCDYTSREVLPVVGLTYSRIEVIAPTCTTKGYTRHYCDQNDTYYDDAFVDELGHDTTVITVDAKCGVAGSITTTCSRCDLLDVKVLEALKHIPGEAATCTTDQKCTLCGIVLTEAHGHNYEVTATLEATAHRAGYITKTCAHCFDAKTAWTDATDGIVVFVDTANGTADGDGTIEAPFNTYTKAFRYAHGSLGRTIVLMSTVTINANYTEIAHAAPYTITSRYDGIDYAGGFDINGTAHYLINGPDTFCDIDIDIEKTSVWQARHNKLVMGSGIVCTGANGLYIVGGVNGNSAESFAGKGTDVTLLSGTYLEVIGGNRGGSKGPITGDINLYIGGTTVIDKVFITSRNMTGNPASGSALVTLDGGVINYYVTTTDASSGNLTKTTPTGPVTVKVTDNFALDDSFNATADGSTVRGISISNVYIENEMAALEAMSSAVVEIQDTVYDVYSVSEKISIYGCYEIIAYEDNNIDGDFDGDGAITNSDITLIIRYLSGWEVDGAVADITNDGKINNRDAIALIIKVSNTAPDL